MKTIRLAAVVAGSLVICPLAIAQAATNSGSKPAVQPYIAPITHSFSNGGAFQADSAEEVPVQSGLIQSTLDPIASHNSFPVRIDVDDFKTGWPVLPEGAKVPGPLSSTFLTQGCAFKIMSSGYTLREFSEDAPGAFRVDNDSVMPQHIYRMSEPETKLFTVNTELRVQIVESTKSNCRRRFHGKTVFLGSVSLAGSELDAITDDGDIAESGIRRLPKPQKLFLKWDDTARELLVVDRGGLVPGLESALFELTPGETGSYFLSFSPNWEFEKQPLSKVAAHH